MSNTEQELKRNLADVPPVPQELFGDISTAIVRQKRVYVGMQALSAVLLFLFAMFSYTHFYQNRDHLAHSETQTTEIVEDELQIVYDYLHGESIDTELEAYAVLDLVLFPEDTNN